MAALENSAQFNAVHGRSALAAVLRSKELKGFDLPDSF